MTSYRIDESLGYILGKTYRKLVQIVSSRFKTYDITLEQWSVLYRLNEKEGISQKELAMLADKDQPTITRILDCLERKAWIRREQNAKDRRSFLIYATESGKKLSEMLAPVEKQTIQDVMAGIPEEQRELLKQLLLCMHETAEGLLKSQNENNGE
jgi:MarR family transcriptional regulator for hemolysin